MLVNCIHWNSKEQQKKSKKNEQDFKEIKILKLINSEFANNQKTKKMLLDLIPYSLMFLGFIVSLVLFELFNTWCPSKGHACLTKNNFV